MILKHTKVNFINKNILCQAFYSIIRGRNAYLNVGNRPHSAMFYCFVFESFGMKLNRETVEKLLGKVSSRRRPEFSAKA